jgi:hypothetical protein
MAKIHPVLRARQLRIERARDLEVPIYLPRPQSRSVTSAKTVAKQYVLLPGSNDLRPMGMAGLPVGAPGGATRASSVGIVSTGGTNITMTPANLEIGPLAMIENFIIVSLDAGIYP